MMAEKKKRNERVQKRKKRKEDEWKWKWEGWNGKMKREDGLEEVPESF